LLDDYAPGWQKGKVSPFLGRPTFILCAPPVTREKAPEQPGGNSKLVGEFLGIGPGLIYDYAKSGRYRYINMLFLLTEHNDREIQKYNIRLGNTFWDFHFAELNN